MNRILATAAALIGFAGAAAACPDYTQYGQEYSASGSDLWAPQSFAITAGGGNMLTACGHNLGGEGYFTSNPDFTFDLYGMRGYMLEVRVVSECDAALLVNTANATWIYDDDSNGNLDPRLLVRNPGDGFLDVWVGTYDGSYCPATLTLETFTG
jgi:hypothetical protein